MIKSVVEVSYTKEVTKLRALREKFEQAGCKGPLQMYFFENGGEELVLSKWGGYAGFLGMMKEAGFSRSHRSEKKAEWQEKYNKKVGV